MEYVDSFDLIILFQAAVSNAGILPQKYWNLFQGATFTFNMHPELDRDIH